MNNKKKMTPLDLKILTVTHSQIGGSSATGQLTGKIWNSCSDDNLLSFCQVLENSKKNQYKIDKNSNYIDELEIAVNFGADICYFYLIRDIHYLKFIIYLIRNLQTPYVIHIMDNWLSDAKNENIDEYYELYRLSEVIIQNANACYAISSPMATFLKNEFVKDFDVLHNFITESEKIVPTKQHKEKIKLLYSGGVHVDINRQAIIDVANLISELSEKIPIEFEIRTFKFYINQIKPFIEKLNNVRLLCIDIIDDYPQCIYDADILLFIQNFTPKCETYMQFSLGNKIPEYLSTGNTIIAYGPTSIYSFLLLKEHNAALSVNLPDISELKKVIYDYVDNKIDLETINKNAQKLLSIEFTMEAILYPFLQNIKRIVANHTEINKKLKNAVILGNGPSLKGFDFINNLKDYTTFGMNAAYRYWDTINWYPDYYCCLDLVVGLSHIDEIKRLIEKSDEYGIKNFMLRDNLIEQLGDIKNKYKVINFDKIYKNTIFLSENRITTGSHTTAWAAEMGFKDILILGIDSNYVEIIPEASLNENKELVINETPKENPNYFFEGYQQAGDKYNIPNHNTDPDQMVHRASWGHLSSVFSSHGVIVINANMQSKLDFFHKTTFEEASDTINSIRCQHYIVNECHECQIEESVEEKMIIDYFENFIGTIVDFSPEKNSSVVSLFINLWQVYYCNSQNEDSNTLNKYITKEKIENIDFLNINSQYNIFKIIKQFPFNEIKPTVIHCRYNDASTVSLGYTMHDLVELLKHEEYTVYISEKYETIINGKTHFTYKLIDYPAYLFSRNSYGSIIAFKNGVSSNKIKSLFDKSCSFELNDNHKALKLINAYKNATFLSIFSSKSRKNKNNYKKAMDELSISVKRKRFLGINILKVFQYEDTRHYMLFSAIPILKKISNKKSYEVDFFGIPLYKRIKIRT